MRLIIVMPLRHAKILKRELVIVREIIASLRLHVRMMQVAKETQTNRCESVPGTPFSSGCSNTLIGNRNLQNIDCTSVSSDCTNDASGNDNRQVIDCSNIEDDCENSSLGNSNTQSIKCANGAEFGCTNIASGDRNKQILDCDRTGIICANTAAGDDISQNILCFNAQTACDNVAGSESSQIIRCFNVESLCGNGASGNGNSQTITCLSVHGDLGCQNGVNEANGSNQDLTCVRMSDCANTTFPLFGANKQSTICANGGSCRNVGLNSKVVSNGVL